WIREQMRRDLEAGFAGHLPEIAPHTAKSGIFGKGRNRPKSMSNPGGQGGEQWWNGETEGNWRSGNNMMTLLAGSAAQRAALDARVAQLLKYQDTDGYLGIYAPELRWGAAGSGELWTQTCLFRGLIAYAEATGNPGVLKAIERAVQLTITNYREGAKPLPDGQHSLMFMDFTERLYELTANTVYRDFGLFLCKDVFVTGRGAASDIRLNPLLDPTLLFAGHGATVCESLRAPIWCASVTGAPLYLAAVDQLFAKAARQLSPTGAPISQEGMEGRVTHPDTAAYECCTQKEWMTSVLSAMQKLGSTTFADRAEDTFFNSVQGARLPDGTAVSYCSLDNCYARNGEHASRVKYSSCHEDVANCCAPNFNQIGPLFVRNMWMRSPDGLAAVLYGPCEVSTTVGGVPVAVTETTSYPFENRVSMVVSPKTPATFTLRLRVPAWSLGAKVSCPGATVVRAGSWLLVTQNWKVGDQLSLELEAQVQPVPANNKEFYLRYGPLFYALPIPSQMKAVKDYPLPGFHDYFVSPVAGAKWNYALADFFNQTQPLLFKVEANPEALAEHPWDSPPFKLTGTFLNQDTRQPETLGLIPLGCGDAKLRRATFPASKKIPRQADVATAAEADLLGSAGIYQDSAATGGSAVGYMGTPGCGIEWRGLPAGSQLKIRYAAEKPGQMTLQVNGAAQKVAFPATSKWQGTGAYAEVMLPVRLPPATTLRLVFEPGDAAANIDSVQVVK
ncbi:MAG: glycoside hydrolase family 127 protein, partial [Verrucomicrobia bacterium]|nr:glycoside hydrolase family 127 protein [Verrucomicrobiota bacterium]